MHASRKLDVCLRVRPVPAEPCLMLQACRQALVTLMQRACRTRRGATRSGVRHRVVSPLFAILPAIHAMHGTGGVLFCV